MIENHIEKLTEDISELLKSIGLLVIESEPTLENVGLLVMVKIKLEDIIKLLEQ